MNLQSYIDLYQLLQNKQISHSSNRSFALEHDLLKKSPQERVLFWIKTYRNSLKGASQSEKFCRYLYGVSLLLAVIAFILGFLTGVALLSYSGKEPVNIIYFLTVAVFMPIVTMVLALISMIKANTAQSMLIHISPAFWMEKVLGFLPGGMQDKLGEFKINPLLLNWLTIKRAQLLSLLFAVGLLLALLSVVATKDIAFAWSTTLQVSPEQFHSFLQALALPWKELFPTVVPSIELIEKSQYFRLGEKLDNIMIDDARILGQWWKFLACATLFYAIILRLLVWLLAKIGFGRALSRSLMNLDSVEKLLYQMNTAVVSTMAHTKEPEFVQGDSRYSRIAPMLKIFYKSTLGWAMSKDDITLLNDTLQLKAGSVFIVGGSNSIEEDSRIIESMRGEVLLYVKSWEPPTMDIDDFIVELAGKAEHIVLVPVGTVADNYRVKSEELDVWSRKLVSVNNPKVWLWQKN
ncbi:MAG: DUF2868 domain-containing protein [Sulfurovum sp.]|nr:DUF2868 domain-containing protein [Sulfurovum sp.]